MPSRKDNTWIYSFLFVCLSLASFAVCHDSNKMILQELEEGVKDIDEGQKTIRLGIRALQDYLLEEIEEAAKDEEAPAQSKTAAEPEDHASNPEVKNFVDRLDKLELNIEAIENHVHGERETDTFLRGLRGDIGKAFDDDMLQVKNLATNMREELKGSFVNVDHDLSAVEDFANSRNVIIGGVLYYGGIGTTCGPSFDVCRVEKSECRDRICQCEPGLSHDSLHEECVDICKDGYGKTYQTVKNYVIRGYNYDQLNETSLEECKERCETDESFDCRSFDYFPRWNTCYLSEFTEEDVEEKAWEYNSAGIHFQRDCIVDKQ